MPYSHRLPWRTLQTEVLGRTLDQHINGDEGAVMGAAFFGASLAPGFRVKDFKVKDALFTPIDVRIVSEEPAEGTVADEDADSLPDKTAELWKAGSRLRSKKTLSFHTARNLTFEMAFGEGAKLSGRFLFLVLFWITFFWFFGLIFVANLLS